MRRCFNAEILFITWCAQLNAIYRFIIITGECHKIFPLVYAISTFLTKSVKAFFKVKREVKYLAMFVWEQCIKTFIFLESVEIKIPTSFPSIYHSNVWFIWLVFKNILPIRDAQHYGERELCSTRLLQTYLPTYEQVRKSWTWTPSGCNGERLQGHCAAVAR